MPTASVVVQIPRTASAATWTIRRLCALPFRARVAQLYGDVQSVPIAHTAERAVEDIEVVGKVVWRGVKE